MRTELGGALARRLATAVLLATLTVGVAAAPNASALDRYELQGGCWVLRAPSGKLVAKDGAFYRASADAADTAEHFRLQATDLGKYLLYGQARDYLAISDARATSAATASPASDFEVTGTGPFTLTSGAGAGQALTIADDATLVGGTQGQAFTFEPAGGCPEFPEAQINAEGPVHTGSTPYGETRGYIDAHMHMMAFEFLGGEIHCGAPWDAYGITVALKGCDRSEIGSPVVESVLSGGVEATNDPVGWPTFKDWPDYNKLTHEQSYYKWLERSWRGGQRLFVNLFVENHALCELYPHKHTNCNEMDSVRHQAKLLKLLERYVDAQNGGPGKGWFRIVSDPFEARRVINAGKLAVVPGIEVSDLFDCGLDNGVSDCTTEQVDQRLDEVYNTLGVRDMELINKFDNGFGGVAGDSTTTGVIVNVGNFAETGRFWNMQPCKGSSEQSDHEQYGLPPLLAPLASIVPPGLAPVYPAGPQCNALGLTTLGEHLVRRMIQKRMLIDPDHLSVLARKQLLNVTDAERYSGVVSSHSWSTADAYPRIYKRGGFVAPYAGGSKGFAATWKKLKSEADPRFYWGIGWGADMNGFGGQGGPRNGPDPVTYPFKSWDGKVTFSREKTGERTFDINTDGVAHYGLYPDWVEDLRMQAGDAIVKDLVRGSEAYLQTWERTVGVRASYECRAARLRIGAKGAGSVPLATPAEDVLRSAGQPRTRVGRLWQYCVTGPAKGRLSVVYDRAGTSALILSTAPRHRALGAGRGSRAARLPAGTRSFGSGLRVKPAGGAKVLVWGVRGGRVRFAGVATRTAAKTPGALRSYLRLAKVKA